MAKEIFADGISGRVAIYDPAYPGALNDPVGNIQHVYFHSDLNYMGIQSVFDAQINHPYRARDVSDSGWFWEDDEYDFKMGSQMWTIANHGLGRIPHAIGIINGSSTSGGVIIQASGASKRTVGVVLNENEVKIYENFLTHNNSLAALSVNYRVILFTDIIQPNGNVVMEATANSFAASRGKLRSDFRYLRVAGVTPPEFYFAQGRTIDTYRSSLRQVSPGGSGGYTQFGYQGDFSGSPPVGVKR